MENIAKDFCQAIHQYVAYWEKQQKKTKKQRLDGLAFSILRLLDGLQPNFDGDIQSLSGCKMLHDEFRETLKKLKD